MRNTSAFNVDEFLQTTIDPQGVPLDTKVSFVPEGEYPAQITALSPREIEQDGKSRRLVEVTWSITDDALRASMGISDPRARQTLWLDTESDGSFIIAKNKNVDTGRLLDALGMNNGRRWSWAQLLHQTAYVRVELPRDQDRAVLSDVKRVAKQQ